MNKGRDSYGQQSQAVLAAESYSKVCCGQEKLEICSRNRVGHLDFRSHSSKLPL